MATIIQNIVFKNTKTNQLYNLYMDAKLHSMITNGKLTISEKPGGKLNLFGSYITGKTLYVADTNQYFFIVACRPTS
jgi:hypothetical protein